MKQSFIQFSQITIEELGDFIEERIANAIKKVQSLVKVKRNLFIPEKKRQSC